MTPPRLTVISYTLSGGRFKLLSLDEEPINETVWIGEGDHEQLR